ncbi:MAG: hypothetical protein U0L05_02240 [Schaedlerella sp.]|nr:hypothetical protein [Schaedlerella sp.]
MKNSAKNISLLGVMIAILEVVKNVLAAIPNVELVTLLIILYALYLGKRVFLVVPAFILIEGCLYGFGLWWIMYLYTWPILAIIAMTFKKQESVWFWSILSAIFGLFYGALSAIPYIFISGIEGAFAWWIAGIPFDIIHCISNFILCLLLFRPLNRVLKRMSVILNLKES